MKLSLLLLRSNEVHFQKKRFCQVVLRFCCYKKFPSCKTLITFVGVSDEHLGVLGAMFLQLLLNQLLSVWRKLAAVDKNRRKTARFCGRRSSYRALIFSAHSATEKKQKSVK